MEKKKLFLTESTESGRLGVVAPSQILEIKSTGRLVIGGVAFFTTDDNDYMSKIDAVASEQPKQRLFDPEHEPASKPEPQSLGLDDAV